MVAVVAPAKPEHIPAFREATKYPGLLLVDPSLRSFRTAGLVRGWARTYHPLAVVKAIAALARGFRQAGRQGDVVQQGGMFVLGPGDRVRFEWRDRYAGDSADLDAVGAAIPPS